MMCKIPYKAGNTAVCQSWIEHFFLHVTRWHLRGGRLAAKPNKQQISGVLMPGSGMDTSSPWRQGLGCEAGYITSIKQCRVVKDKKKEERGEKSSRYLQRLKRKNFL